MLGSQVRPTVRSGTLVAVLALCSFAGSACSKADPANHSLASPAAGVASVFGTQEDARVLHLAEQTLIQECMRSQGFEFEISPMLEDDPAQAHPYGFDDRASASTTGYNLAPRPEGATESSDGAPSDANGTYLASLPPEREQAFTYALFGPPDGKTGTVTVNGGLAISFPLEGCLADARDRLYADGEAFMSALTVVDNLGSEVQDRVVSSDAYLDALDVWRACMSDRGYDVERPSDAVRLVIANGSDKTYEIEVATADAACSQEASLVATAERVESDVWNDVLDANTGVIDAYRELRDPAIAAARDLLGS